MRPRNRSKRRLMVHRNPQTRSIPFDQLAHRLRLTTLYNLQRTDLKGVFEVLVLSLGLLCFLFLYILRGDPYLARARWDSPDAYGRLLHDQDPDEGHVSVVDPLGACGGMMSEEVGDEVSETKYVAS